MIAIFLMPIAVVDSVHVLSEFADTYKRGDDANVVIRKVMAHLLTPMLFTSITSAVGFFSLMLTPIPPVQVFGAFIGIGIILAFVLTITFIPAFISRLSEQTLVSMQLALADKSDRGKLSMGLKTLGRWATSYRKLALLGFIVLFVISIEGIRSIEINDNPINWFKSDHEIRVADKVLNEHFAGTYDAWLVFEKQSKQLSSVDEITGLVDKLNDQEIKMNLHAALASKAQAHQSQLKATDLQVLLEDSLFAVDGKDGQLIEQIISLVEQDLTANKAFINPQVLNYLKDLQQEFVASGLVGKVNSLADIVSTVNRELQGGVETDFVIPKSQNAVAQTLLQYQSSHRPDDLWHFVSKDYSQTLLWLQLTSGDNQHMNKVIDWFDNYLAANPLPEGVDYHWAGKAYINVVWQDAMVAGMLNSLLSSFVVVFVMMVFLFRSLKYGVLAMLPLTFTITLIYGLIGWSGKAYDMPIAVLSALTLGLSIDFAIHFLQRFKELHLQTGNAATALSLMFDEPARAIARNAIVIAIGFTPLLLSPLVPYITVGFFLATIMAASALVTLILLPALLTSKKAG
jgi:predicted RND superfamily exporter protein